MARKRTQDQFVRLGLIVLTAPEKRGALACLDAIEKLFGPKGQHWVKQEYHTVEEGLDRFCLSGAAMKVNGVYEPLARAAISLAVIEKEKDVEPFVDSGDDLIINFNDRPKTTWTDVKRVLKRAREIVKAA